MTEQPQSTNEQESNAEDVAPRNLVTFTPQEIIKMVNENSLQYVKVLEERQLEGTNELALAMSDQDLFNNFFALEFLYRSGEGAQYVSQLDSEANSLMYYEFLIAVMETRLGLSYDSKDNLIVN